MIRYDSYKESGVDWLGRIPTHWDSKRLKQLVELNPGKTEVTDIPDSTEVSFLPMERIGEDGSIDLSEVRPLSAIQNGYTYCRENDVIVAKITPCFENGKGALCKGLKNNIAFGSTEFIVLRAAQRSDPRFIYYVTKSDAFMKLGEAGMTGAAGQKRISDFFVSNFRLAAPNIAEQKSIARYLDKELARINQLIANERQQIKKLDELRQITISHAVTRGLDPTVPMKESGIDWLGEIPAHWGCERLKHLVHLNPVKSEVSSLLSLTEVSFLPMEKVESDGRVDLTETRPISKLREGYTYCRDGDVIFAKITPCFENGKGALCKGLKNGIGFGSTEFIVLRAKSHMLPRYIYYLTKTNRFMKLGESRMTGSAGQKRVPESFVSNFMAPLPDRDTQIMIADFLDKETMKFDLLRSNLDLQIEKLEELRKITINDAVTGKVKVAD